MVDLLIFFRNFERLWTSVSSLVPQVSCGPQRCPQSTHWSQPDPQVIFLKLFNRPCHSYDVFISSFSSYFCEVQGDLITTPPPALECPPVAGSESPKSDSPQELVFEDLSSAEKDRLCKELNHTCPNIKPTSGPNSTWIRSDLLDPSHAQECPHTLGESWNRPNDPMNPLQPRYCLPTSPSESLFWTSFLGSVICVTF